MYFDLDDDQRALVATVGDLTERHFPIDVARAWGEPGGFRPSAWRALAEIGTFAMTQPADRGGLEMATIDQVLVFQALGAGLVPGPVVAAVLAAELFPAAADGSLVPAIAVRPGPGDGPVVPTIVEHLGDADVLLIVDADGVWRADPAALAATRLPQPVDPTTPLWLVDELPAGERVADAATAARWRLLGSLLSSAQLAGGAVRVTEIATTYAGQREQFGRRIGSFQAVKHLLADCFARGEVARAAVDAAGVRIDDPAVDQPGAGGAGGLDGGGGDGIERAVAGARTVAAKAAVTNAKTAIQVHGGMGFTWETTPHLYLKRAWVNETAFTTPDQAAEAVAATL